MRKVKVTTVTAFGETAGRYDYDRVSKVIVSEEHFPANAGNELIARFITMALAAKVSIDTDVKTVEIPEDEEESAVVKLEAMTKTKQDYYERWTKAQEESKAKDSVISELTAQVNALTKVCPHTDDEDEE